MSQSNERDGSADILVAEPWPGSVEDLRRVERLIFPSDISTQELHLLLKDGRVFRAFAAAIERHSPIHLGSYDDKPSATGFRAVQYSSTIAIQGRRQTRGGATDYSYSLHKSKFRGLEASLIRNGAADLSYTETTDGRHISGDPRVVGMVAIEAAADLATELENRRRIRDGMSEMSRVVGIRRDVPFMELAEDLGIIPKE